MDEISDFDSPDPGLASERIEAALGRLRDWLGKNDWNFDEADDGTYLRTGVQGANARFRIVLGVRGGGPSFLCFALYDFTVPAPRRPLCADLINRINYEALLGNFEMDVDDGELRFRVTFPLDEAEISDAQIERAIVVASMMADRNYPAFLGLIHAGLDPKAALESIDRIN